MISKTSFVGIAAILALSAASFRPSADIPRAIAPPLEKGNRVSDFVFLIGEMGTYADGQWIVLEVAHPWVLVQNKGDTSWINFEHVLTCNVTL